MRALLEQLPATGDSSFKLYKFNYAHFPTPWHYHPEVELVLVTQSRGQRIIGNHIGTFQPGDVVLIGPNLPHTYHNDADYYVPDSPLRAESIVIHFLPDFLGATFYDAPEFAPVRALLARAAVGLHVTGEHRADVAERIEGLFHLHGLPRLLALLDILHLLAHLPGLEPLSTEPLAGRNPEEDAKLNRLFSHIARHYQRPIPLAELAALVHMTEPSLCRFFRKRTRKTLVQFINETKIGHACQLLLQPDQSVAEAAFASGFNNLSHFNRQFREIKGVSPQVYRQQARGLTRLEQREGML